LRDRESVRIGKIVQNEKTVKIVEIVVESFLAM